LKRSSRPEISRPARSGRRNRFSRPRSKNAGLCASFPTSTSRGRSAAPEATGPWPRSGSASPARPCGRGAARRHGNDPRRPGSPRPESLRILGITRLSSRVPIGTPPRRRGSRQKRRVFPMPSSTARAARMPKKELEKYRRLLQEKKSGLMAELAKTKNAEEETTEESTQDIADKAVSSYTREFLYSLNDSERNT